MGRRLNIGDKVKVILDETGEFIGCVGKVSYFNYEHLEAPIGVAFGRADNTILLPNGEWGAWFARGELKLTNEEKSPICPVPTS